MLDAAVPPPTDASLAEVMATMRAMRRLRPDPVPSALIDELIGAAMLAPTAGHQQAEVFIVVTDRDRIARLADVWRRSIEIYENWFSKADPRVGTDPKIVRLWDAVHYQRDHFAETPVVIVACYDQRAYVSRAMSRRRDMLAAFRRMGVRRAVWLLRHAASVSTRNEGASIYPAVQNLLLAARARGLGANLTTWHLFLEPDLKAVLDIPKDIDTFAVIPIGWPMGNFGPVVRRPVAEVIRRDHW